MTLRVGVRPCFLPSVKSPLSTIHLLLVLLTFLGARICLKADPLDNWYVRSPGNGLDHLYAVAYGNGNFIAVGTSGIKMASTNGSNWVTGSFGNSAEKNCIGFGNGYFFTASKAPGSDTNNTVISTNSSNWMGLFASNYINSARGAASAGGTYFLVGSQSTIVTATNFNLSCVGSRTNNCNWVRRNSGGNKNLEGIAYGNGVYVVVGDDVALTSTNSVTWSTNIVFTPGAFKVAFGNGVFVAVGWSGSIYLSSNGVSWSKQVFGADNLQAVTFANGTFVVVGNSGKILSSLDGVVWQQRTNSISDALTGITFGNGTFVACSIQGGLFQSAPVGIPSLTASGAPNGVGINLAMSGEIGRGYRIQARTNLAEGDWEDFLSFTNTGPVMEFLDTSVTNLPSRFYRAVSP